MNTRRAAASRRTTISQTQQLAKPKVSSRTYVAAAFSHRDIGHVWGSLRRIPESFWVCAARVVAEFKRAGSARQLVSQLAWQLGSVDLRSRLAKQSRGVDYRRIAIQRKRKAQIVTKVVNSGALKGLFLAK